nr:unnamed protein product [Spirometra erinaceieuropaei]
MESTDSDAATTIFAADEDIQEGQLIVFLLLHRKLDVREDGVDLFFERQHLIPFDDDEGVIHIPSPHSWCHNHLYLLMSLMMDSSKDPKRQANKVLVPGSTIDAAAAAAAAAATIDTVVQLE